MGAKVVNEEVHKTLMRMAAQLTEEAETTELFDASGPQSGTIEKGPPGGDGNTDRIFHPGQVRFLLGGSFPDCGFDWSRVCYFFLDDGVLYPYGKKDEVLSGPSFKVKAVEAEREIQLHLF